MNKFTSKDLWKSVKELVRKHETDEGCLSIPGYWEPVTRAEKIQVKALDREGNEFILDADDFLAVCIQHEMDHLEGKLFIDYISKTKRGIIRKRLLRQQKLSNQKASD